MPWITKYSLPSYGIKEEIGPPKPIPQQIKEKMVEVFFTGKNVNESEAYALVPKGFRMARLDEVALRYRYDPKFRNALDSTSGVWVDQKGLGTVGPYRINEKGQFEKVTGKLKTFYEEFQDLYSMERSWHYPGDGLVIVVGNHFRGLGLNVNANTSYSSAQVAYVALEVGVAGLKVLAREAQPSIAKLEQTTIPEISEPLKRLAKAASEIKE